VKHDEYLENGGQPIFLISKILRNVAFGVWKKHVAGEARSMMMLLSERRMEVFDCCWANPRKYAKNQKRVYRPVSEISKSRSILNRKTGGVHVLRRAPGQGGKGGGKRGENCRSAKRKGGRGQRVDGRPERIKG